MSTTDRSFVIRLAQAEAGIPGPAGERSVSVLRRGTLDVALGTPARPNEQTPHEQDEVYIVIRGRGVLFHDGKRDPFESGDLLFVAAATEHRFEDFSDDLLVWRVFYGRRGGRLPAGSDLHFTLCWPTEPEANAAAAGVFGRGWGLAFCQSRVKGATLRAFASAPRRASVFSRGSRWSFVELML